MTASSLALSLSLCAAALLPQASSAQAFPSKPVTMVLGYAAGGGFDALAREFALRLGEALGQTVIVENKAGASGAIAADAVANASPDGYTLHVSETGYLVNGGLGSKAPVDRLARFAPVSLVASLPLVIAVPTSSPARTVRELIDHLRARPASYSYGSPGNGTIHHLTAEEFKRVAKMDVAHIPYKGTSPMLADLFSERLAFGMLSTAAAAGPVAGGKLRALAVTSSQRMDINTTWPTLAETLPGFVVEPLIFIVAPAGTPAAVLKRLNDASAVALARPELKTMFANGGATPGKGTPDELRKLLEAETKRWQAIAKGAGVTGD